MAQHYPVDQLLPGDLTFMPLWRVPFLLELGDDQPDVLPLVRPVPRIARLVSSTSFRCLLPGKAELGIRERLSERNELYDPERDPDELHNRIDDAACRDVRAELSERIARWYLETGDAVPYRLDQRRAGEPMPHYLGHK